MPLVHFDARPQLPNQNKAHKDTIVAVASTRLRGSKDHPANGCDTISGTQVGESKQSPRSLVASKWPGSVVPVVLALRLSPLWIQDEPERRPSGAVVGAIAAPRIAYIQAGPPRRNTWVRKGVFSKVFLLPIISRFYIY
jgi:hypothetical protein